MAPVFGVGRAARNISAPGILKETYIFQCVSANRSYELLDSGGNRLNSRATSDFDSGPSMPHAQRLTSAERNRVYRERLRANGGEEVLFKLPSEIVTLLDELKKRQGLRNRSQALMQLIEQGRATAQQMT